MLRRSLAAAALVLLAAACSSEDDDLAALPASSSCPPAASAAAWPSPVPADLPRPAGLAPQAPSTDSGLTAVRFTAAGGLRDVLRPLLDQLPAAGYRVTGGDQENGEADVEFEGKGVEGRLKLTASESCTTSGLLRVRSRS